MKFKEDAFLYFSRISPSHIRWNQVRQDILEKVLRHWLGVIRPLFPANAEFRAIISDRSSSIISKWSRKTDSEKIKSQFCKIKISFIDEDLYRYFLTRNDNLRQDIDTQLRNHITSKLENFPIDADSRYLKAEWKITADVFKRRRRDPHIRIPA